MSNSLKDDVLKAVQGNASTKNDTTVKLKSPQVLKHSLDSVFKSPQSLMKISRLILKRKMTKTKATIHL